MVDEEIIKIVKLADILDAVMFIGDEIRAGNQDVVDLYMHLHDQLKDRLVGMPTKVTNKIVNMVYHNDKNEPRLIK